MVASTSSNLVAIVGMLAHSIPIEQITVQAAAAEYARRFAQHNLSLEALLGRTASVSIGSWSGASRHWTGSTGCRRIWRWPRCRSCPGG